MNPEHIPVFIEMTECKHLSLTDIVIYGAVYFYSFKGENIFNQSYDTTASKLGITKNTVKASLKKLTDYGVIADLSPDRLNAPHDYKPVWVPEFGYQKLVSSADEAYQKLVPRIPKIGIQKPKRIPKIGTNKNNTKNNKKAKPNGAGANAPEANGNAPTTPKKILMAEFQLLTGLKMPHRKSDIGFWWSNIGEVLAIADNDAQRAKQLIKMSVEKLRADKLTIGGPQSIINTCRALAAETSGNGKHLVIQ